MGLITLNNKLIDDVHWVESGLCPYHVDKQIDVWRINVTDNILYLESFNSILNASEQTRAEKYLRDAGRNRFIISRGALRNILGKYLKQLPNTIEFKLGANQKPYVESSLHYNLSDSADWIVIAVAGSEIGVDVEFVKPDFSFDSILQSHFNTKEIEYIKQADSPNRFFKLWTRKEAILKATGVGLTEYLTSITALDGMHTLDGEKLYTKRNWLLSTFMLAENYPVTIAANLSLKEYYFYNFRL